MRVNTDGLRAGAKVSYNAADHAHEGSGTLSRTAVSTGIFGNFSEAKTFGQKIAEAHAHHVGLMNRHTEKLGTIGDKARGAASGFDDMERRNEARVRAVRDAL